MKTLKITCSTASTKQGDVEIEKSRELAEITINVADDFQLTEEIKTELSKQASDIISGIATKEGDVYQCNCTLES